MPQTRTISLSESVLFSAQGRDDLSEVWTRSGADWPGAHNPRFLDRMRRIRNEEDLAEKGKDLTEVLR